MSWPVRVWGVSGMVLLLYGCFQQGPEGADELPVAAGGPCPRGWEGSVGAGLDGRDRLAAHGAAVRGQGELHRARVVGVPAADEQPGRLDRADKLGYEDRLRARGGGEGRRAGWG